MPGRSRAPPIDRRYSCRAQRIADLARRGDNRRSVVPTRRSPESLDRARYSHRRQHDPATIDHRRRHRSDTRFSLGDRFGPPIGSDLAPQGLAPGALIDRQLGAGVDDGSQAMRRLERYHTDAYVALANVELDALAGDVAQCTERRPGGGGQRPGPLGRPTEGACPVRSVIIRIYKLS